MSSKSKAKVWAETTCRIHGIGAKGMPDNYRYVKVPVPVTRAQKNTLGCPYCKKKS